MLKVIATLVYLVLSFYTLSVQGAWAAVSPKPNILLLLADDLGYNDSGLYEDVDGEGPVHAMPNLQALGRDGVRFTRFYTESTCSASRVALLTGQYPLRQGFIPAGRGISPDVVTLADYLRAQGYRTHHVGKWHVGEFHRESLPAAQGFDTSLGFLNQWMLQGPNAEGRIPLRTPTYRNPWLLDERDTFRQYPGHLEDILVAHTIEKMQQAGKDNDDRPWFIYHAFLLPHTPLQADTAFAKNFPDTPEGKFKAQLAQMDHHLKQLFDALRQSGQWDNTIIIFASDNGSTARYGNSNAPFDGGKGEYDEGGIRTPLVIKWHRALVDSMPAQELQSLRRDPVSMMDIYPSLQAVTGSSFAGAGPSPFDGQPHLLPQVHKSGRAPDPTPRFFLSFDALSVFDDSYRRRLLRQWSGGQFTDESLLRYRQDGFIATRFDDWWSRLFEEESSPPFPDDSLPADDLADNKLAARLFDNFLGWYQAASKVPVHAETMTKADGHTAYRVSGSDFVRSPVNPAFAVAFAFTAKDVQSQQTLLSQPGLLQVSLERGTLFAVVHNLQVEIKDIQPNQCYRIILSGEFHDRHSRVQEALLPSYVHLLMNGKVVASSSGSIEDLTKVNINTPTYAGIRDEKDRYGLKGKISAPQFFVTQLLPDDPLLADNVKKIDAGLCDAL